MSFILDALKKSELERQRQSAPGIVEPGAAPRRPRLPVWAVVLAVLLGINLIGLTYVLTRGGPAATVARIPAAPPVDERPPAADTAFSPLDPEPVYAPEIPVSGSAAGDRAETGTEPRGGRESPAAPRATPVAPVPGASGAARATHRRDPLLNDQDFKAEDAEILPSVNELNLTGAQALPELHLDVHVFSTRPADRFVYVNMRKYHEGATLQEGPTVERIRRDGAVLNYQGLRFLLPRQ